MARIWARVLALGALALIVGPGLPVQSPLPSQPISLAAASVDEPFVQKERNPHRREYYFYQQRAAPFDDVPPQALVRARQEATDRVRSGAIGIVSQGDVRTSAVSESSWTSIGPQPIASGLSAFGNGEHPTSGRVSALAVVDANTVYLGAASGGVWKTTDGGVTWRPLTDTQPSLAIGAIALDPTNSSIVYVGLGEQTFSGSNYYGYGILKSTDGGSTWSHRTASFFDRDRIGRIAVDPNNPSIVYAAANSGLARSTDGGTTWTRMRFTGSTFTDVVIDPSTTPSTVYIARGAVAGSTENGVYRSRTNLDHVASSWTRLSGTGANTFPTFDPSTAKGTGRVRLSITRTAQPTLYAAVHDVDGDKLLGVWKTADGGVNWMQTAHPETSAGARDFSICGQCDYDLNIAVSPGDANIVYVLAIELYGSTDGGANWTLLSNGYATPYRLHVDQHAFDFIPGSANSFYLGNDGGVYRSTDGGRTFTNLNQGLSITQFYQGAAHPTDVTSAVGGTQDNGTLSFEGSTSWHRSIGGDGGYAAIDFENPQTVFGSVQHLGLRRSTTGPRGGFSSAVSGIPDRESEPRRFIAPIVMDPTNPRVLYAATTRLYRSADSASSWSAISPVLAGASNSFNAISAIAVSRTDPNTIYLGTGSSTAAAARLWVTTDAGASQPNWSDRSAGLPNRTVKSIAVDPGDRATAYVAFSGFNSATASTPGHVFKTTNGGATWTNVSGSLPDSPANSIIVDPASGQTLYLATDVGVFKSTDGGTAWAAMNTGLPNAVVHDIVLNRAGTRLFAFTHGRGVYVADRAGLAGPTPAPRPTSTPTTAPTSGDNARARSGPYSFTIAPGGSTPRFDIVFENAGTTTWRSVDGYTLREEASESDLGLDCEGLRAPGTCTRGTSFRFGQQTGRTQLRFRMYHGSTGFGDTIIVAVTVTTDTPTPTTVAASPTATPTTTGLASPTATPTTVLVSPTPTTGLASPTATPTTAPASPTATPTPRPDTATPVGSTVGGRGFSVSVSSAGVSMSWSPGNAQASYVLARIRAQGAGFEPLGAAATSYVDANPGAGVTCYLLLALDARGSVAGISDLYCVVRGTQSPMGAPQDFAIQLNQSPVATLSWTGPLGGGQDGYVLLLLGGTPIGLGGTITRTTVRLTGVGCFLLVPTRGGQPAGTTDILCGVPAVSNLGAGRTDVPERPSTAPGVTQEMLFGAGSAGSRLAPSP